MFCCIVCVSGFQQAFAVTRDVTKYGAVPDDGIDDIAFITIAVNSSDSGDILYFPAGTYDISSPIFLKTGMKLKGAGRDKSVIRYIGHVLEKVINIEGKSDIEISDIAIVGNSFCTIGISAAYGSNLYLHNLLIKDFTCSDETYILGIHLAIDDTGSVISDNIISNMGINSKWGGGIRLSSGSSGNQILRNTISYTGRGGIFADANSHTNIYRDNKVSKCGLTAEGLGIEIWHGCGNSIIEDNIIDHWLSVAGSDYSSIRRNTISAKDSGTYAFCGIELAEGTNCIFTDNTFDDGANIGISISDTPNKNYVYWAYNTIRHATTWGMQIQGVTEGTSCHYFYGNKFSDINQDESKMLYTGQGHAVRFNDNDYSMVFDSNEFSGNNAALQFLGDLNSFSFINNTFSNNRILILGSFPGIDLEFNGNTCSGNMLGNELPSSTGFRDKKPSADFNYKQDGLRVAFNNASFDEDDEIIYYLWDFNDGVPVTDRNPVHVFPSYASYRIALIVWDNSGRGARIEKMVNVSEGTSVSDENTSGQEAFILVQNYPNPFNPATTISFSLPSKSFVSLKVFDVLGKEVAIVVAEELSAGKHSQQWNANGLPSGVYFYRLQAGSFTQTKKLVLLR